MRSERGSPRRILCVNRGSSSLKIAVYEVDATTERRILEDGLDCVEGRDPIAASLASIRSLGIEIDAVGHRLVYGGPAREAPAVVTAELLADLTALVPFDRLHLPAALAAIREIEKALPHLPQVVCFDTAFHRSMPMVARLLPLPRELWSEDVRRYGFHGLSYESIVRGLGETGARGRLIVAHLGSGASLAAIRDGASLDTTMGFSPLGGLMMGTRPGDLDPGILLYLLREGRYTAAQLSEVLTDRSGLLGVSQVSADMQVLLERRASDAAAAEAVRLFVYAATKHAGALVAVAGGLDTLVFTGGIGENAAPVRSEIADGLAYLGLEIDPSRNAAGAAVISTDASAVVARVMPSNENLMVGRHTFATLFAAYGTAASA